MNPTDLCRACISISFLADVEEVCNVLRGHKTELHCTAVSVCQGFGKKTRLKTMEMGTAGGKKWTAKLDGNPQVLPLPPYSSHTKKGQILN